MRAFPLPAFLSLVLAAAAMVSLPGRSAAPAGSVHSPASLAAQGLHAQPASASGQWLLCNGDSGLHCVCVAPLACGDRCLDEATTLKAFHAALAARGNGRSVTCRRAETGRCGAFRYFDFDGDIERHELRWFDAGGRLVGQRNWTDYAAWCDGRANTLVQGSVPQCDAVERETLVCGDASGASPRPPLQDLLERAARNAR